METAKDAWHRRYDNPEVLDVHMRQTMNFGVGFCKTIVETPVYDVLRKANRIIDIGCGCGELALIVSGYFNKRVYGIDLSELAIENATRRYSHSLLSYGVWDFMEKGGLPGKWDVGIVSHVIEHFKDIYTPIDLLLKDVKHLIIVSPYRDDDIHTGQSVEGSRSHLTVMTESVLRRYKPICNLYFATHMWRRGQQWIAMIESETYEE